MLMAIMLMAGASLVIGPLPTFEQVGWLAPILLLLAVAFIIGGLLALSGLWLRRSLAETEQFEENKAKALAVKRPLLTTLREHPRAVAQLVGFTLLSTLCYYTFFSALTPYAVDSRGEDAGDVFLALSIGTALFVVLQYPFGLLSDKFGRKPQLLVWSGSVTILIVPLSTLIGSNLFGLIVVFCTGLGLYSRLSPIAPAVTSELFPTALRGLGIGAWYNLTVVLFGGMGFSPRSASRRRRAPNSGNGLTRTLCA